MMKYFTHSELACSETGIVRLAPNFAAELIKLREKWNTPMIVNSCCRSKSYNQKIKGNPRSLHIYDQPHYPTNGTCAIDISIQSSCERGKLVHLAWELRWSIGINKRFLHLDRRTDHTNLKQVMFLY